MPHSATGQPPNKLWHDQPRKPKRLFTFGQLGAIPLVQPKKKLDPRGTPVRYAYGNDHNTITVQELNTHRYRTIRTADFRPYSRTSDPCYRPLSAYRSQASPITVEITTPDPKAHREAQNYPDAEEWATAHNEEVDKLDKSQTILWIPDKKLPPRERLIPLKMTYRYKRAPDGTVTQL